MSQMLLRNKLLDVLRAASQFAMANDPDALVHEKLNEGFALLANDSYWNGETGTNGED